MLAAGQKDPGALLTIGELSQELGVAQHILRYWESALSRSCGRCNGPATAAIIARPMSISRGKSTACSIRKAIRSAACRSCCASAARPLPTPPFAWRKFRGAAQSPFAEPDERDDNRRHRRVSPDRAAQSPGGRARILIEFFREDQLDELAAAGRDIGPMVSRQFDHGKSGSREFLRDAWRSPSSSLPVSSRISCWRPGIMADHQRRLDRHQATRGSA